MLRCKSGNQDIPGGHYGGIGIKEMGRVGVKLFQAPVQESNIYPAAVRGVKVDNPVIQFSKDGSLCQAPQYKRVFNFRKADNFRHRALLGRCPEDPLSHGVTLGVESFPGPMAGAAGGEIGIRDACGVVSVIKEVLKVPEHYVEGVRVACKQEEC